MSTPSFITDLLAALAKLEVTITVAPRQRTFTAPAEETAPADPRLAELSIDELISRRVELTGKLNTEPCSVELRRDREAAIAAIDTELSRGRTYFGGAA